jgi:hypothetical protein
MTVRRRLDHHRFNQRLETRTLIPLNVYLLIITSKLTAIRRHHTKSWLTTPFWVETRQMAKGRWQKKEKVSGKKGVIKADLVSIGFKPFKIEKLDNGKPYSR